jgi:hypothetical protein
MQFAQLKDEVEGRWVEEMGQEDAESPVPAKKRRVGGICSEYLNAIETDRLQLEETLAADAALAAEQR